MRPLENLTYPVLGAVQQEGDRGAILVAGEILTEFLLNALTAIRPGVLEKKV